MNNKTMQTNCPLCENRCDLAAPRCGRGATYAADCASPCGGSQPAEPRTPHEVSVADQLMRLFRNCFISLGRCHRSQEGGSALHGQGRILELLAHFDQISQRALVQESRLRPASLGELLQKIEKSGYIVREQDQADRRNRIIALTERGKAAVALASQEREAQAKRLFSVLTDAEQQSLAGLLQKLSEAWGATSDNLHACEHHHQPHRHGHGFSCKNHPAHARRHGRDEANTSARADE